MADAATIHTIRPKSESAICTHHWLLGEPAHGVIAGECKYCHATRTYSSNPEGNDRFDDYREVTAASTYHVTQHERLSA